MRLFTATILLHLDSNRAISVIAANLPFPKPVTLGIISVSVGVLFNLCAILAVNL